MLNNFYFNYPAIYSKVSILVSRTVLWCVFIVYLICCVRICYSFVALPHLTARRYWNIQLIYAQTTKKEKEYANPK